MIARPPGMFSVVGTMPMTLIGALSSAMARIAPITAAPPAMSSFIRSMPSAGLIEMPPVSKVMPLPTRPSTGAAGAPGGSWRSTIMRGGSALPRATPSSRPICSRAISSSSRTSTCSPALAADGRAALGEDRRRQHVRRLVAEVAREVARLAEDPAALDRRFERGVVALPRDDQRLLERRRAALAALVDVAAEGRQHQAFGDRLHGGGRLAAAAVEEGDPLHAPLSRRERRGGRDLAQPLGAEVRRPCRRR